MFKVSVPSTSANLCVGFDTLGIAFNLFNVFQFEKKDKDQLVGFKEEYLKPENNLVLKTYKSYFEKFGIRYIPVKIEEVKENVFTSSGLGSSATCVVAGALGAYLISGKTISIEELDKFVTDEEGHPDNVIPALHGGLCACFKDLDKIKYIKYEVSSELKFYALVPSFKLETSVARKALPECYKISDVTNNLSRIVNLPYALKEGDIGLLKSLLKDKIHEPYRLPLIENSNEVYEYFSSLPGCLMVSGAGPSLLYITKDDLEITSLYGFKVYKLSVCLGGANYEEI